MTSEVTSNQFHLAPNISQNRSCQFDFLDFIRDASQMGLDVHGICVRQHDHILGQFHWWDGRRTNIHSCSKSILSLALGIAIGDGLISLDERIIDIFPDLSPANPSENLQKITIRNLITMTPGYDGYILPGWKRDWEPDKDWAHYCLHQEVPYVPGERFVYNNASAILVSRAIQLRTGEKLVSWLKPRLFDPLDIPNPQWFSCPLGYTVGAGDLFLNLEEMSRIGQLCLNDGMWDGKQLVPKEYVRQATSYQVSNKGNSMSSGPDSNSGYGFFFWIMQNPNVADAYGMYGQHIYINRELDAVVTTTGHLEQEEMRQRLYNIIKKDIFEKLH